MNTKMSTGEITEVTPAHAFKPVDDINKIIEQIAPFATRFNANKGEVLRYHSGKKRTCYILHQGGVTLNRRGDGMVLNSEQATFIMGISNQFSQTENLYVRVNENAVMSRLSLERFNLLIESF